MPREQIPLWLRHNRGNHQVTMDELELGFRVAYSLDEEENTDWSALWDADYLLYMATQDDVELLCGVKGSVVHKSDCVRVDE